jgi:hypothetical protein
MGIMDTATEEEISFYLAATNGLPQVAGFSGTGFDKSGNRIPYGVGPHSVRAMRDACRMANPKNILEIGFAQGYSSSLFLSMIDAQVTSVEIDSTDESLAAERMLSERWPGRHRVFRCDSAKCRQLVEDRKYDMIFIDGGHLEHHVEADVKLALDLGIPWLFFDDWLPQFGPGVQPVIKRVGVEIVYLNGNMAMGTPKILPPVSMHSLGGSVFVRNAIRFGYCILETLDSLYALCDQVSILECGSDDGTQDLIEKWISTKEKWKIKYTRDHPWDVAPDYSRLAVLANAARSQLTTSWHFMLQADEVLHESAFTLIRELISRDHATAFFCRRLNLFLSPDTYVRLDSAKKPCGDMVCRLARTEYEVVGDAESIGSKFVVEQTWVDKLVIFHYGYVREGRAHIDKALDMQSWFFGPGSSPDQRIVRMKASDYKFDASQYMSPEDVTRIPLPHPMFSRKLAERLAKLC